MVCHDCSSGYSCDTDCVRDWYIDARGWTLSELVPDGITRNPGSADNSVYVEISTRVLFVECRIIHPPEGRDAAGCGRAGTERRTSRIYTPGRTHALPQ